ncbi:MAG: hypothetical protein ACPL7J_12120 [Desulfomonilaceae bacterium]
MIIKNPGVRLLTLGHSRQHHAVRDTLVAQIDEEIVSDCSQS